MKKLLIILSLVFFFVGIGMAYVPEELFIETGSIAAVLILAFPAFLGMYKIYGKRGLLAVVALGLFALVIETIGIYIGFPYSHFNYTSDFGYRLFGSTPWTVFVAWSPLVIGAYLLAQSWFKQWWSQILIYLGLLVGADLVLDPGAVARGLWQYEQIGLWYQVPIQNFLGWIFSGTIVYLILKIGLPKVTISNKNLIIGGLSLVLSIALWTGVTGAYELYLPSAIGLVLLVVIIFGLLKKPSR